MTRLRIVAALGVAAATAVVPAAPLHAAGSGGDFSCVMHADVRVDRAAGTYALDGVASPCDPVVVDSTPRTESGTLHSSGTFTGDPCGSATSTGLLEAEFRWRTGILGFPLGGTWVNGAVVLQGRLSARTVTATLALIPRDDTCDGLPTDFLAVGQISIDYFPFVPPA